MAARDATLLVRLSRVLVAGVPLVGGLIVVHALFEVTHSPLPVSWLILAGLTWIGGSFAIKIPSLPAAFYVSETFIIAQVLIFGTAPAITTVAIDGAFASLRGRRKDIKRCLFNITEPAISLFVAATVFYHYSGFTPLALAVDANPELARLLPPVAGMAVVYFLVNLLLAATAVHSGSGKLPSNIWKTQVVWMGLNTIGGASLGLLLAITSPALRRGDLEQLSQPGSLSGVEVILPLLLMSYLTFRMAVARVEDSNRHLAEMSRLHFSTVETLSVAIDAKDQVTFGHITRVRHYATQLARARGITEGREFEAIQAAALLHDIGKLTVPEFILKKPGPLTPAECERMKLHASQGASILSQIDFPYPVVPIVRHHHENWDGTGYPDGLSGEGIPLGARIMAVVDCYDALTSDRPYRRALSHDAALAIIATRRGTMYDPRVVDAFVSLPAETVHAGLPDLPASAVVARLPERPPAEAVGDAALPPGGSGGSAEEVLLLCDLAGGLAAWTTLDDIAAVMSRRLRRMVPAPLVVFYLPDGHSTSMVARHASGPGEDALDGLRVLLGDGITGWVAANRRTVANANPALDLGDRLNSMSPRLESALSVPLVSDGELVGVLTLYAATREAFSDAHRRLAELLAAQIADTIARDDDPRATRLRDRATGLPNAVSLERLMASRVFADMSRLSFGVVCFAVDEVDAAAGGRRESPVLRVAEAARQMLRTTDLVFRYSDDELVILMPDTGPAVVTQVAHRIAERLADGPGGDGSPLRLGLAFAPRDGSSIDDLLRTARGQLARHRPADPGQGAPAAAAPQAGGAVA